VVFFVLVRPIAHTTLTRSVLGKRHTPVVVSVLSNKSNRSCLRSISLLPSGVDGFENNEPHTTAPSHAVRSPEPTTTMSSVMTGDPPDRPQSLQSIPNSASPRSPFVPRPSCVRNRIHSPTTTPLLLLLDGLLSQCEERIKHAIRSIAHLVVTSPNRHGLPRRSTGLVRHLQNDINEEDEARGTGDDQDDDWRLRCLLSRLPVQPVPIETAEGGIGAGEQDNTIPVSAYLLPSSSCRYSYRARAGPGSSPPPPSRLDGQQRRPMPVSWPPLLPRSLGLPFQICTATPPRVAAAPPPTAAMMTQENVVAVMSLLVQVWPSVVQIPSPRDASVPLHFAGSLGMLLVVQFLHQHVSRNGPGFCHLTSFSLAQLFLLALLRSIQVA
jgi:hypothetical protein